ncbi:MAG: glycoside hydrolase family 2 [Dysgonamonadaceae bacterium]|nr:glycoside hydrolase family 2 [Dysgonamonadaceae bacterium]
MKKKNPIVVLVALFLLLLPLKVMTQNQSERGKLFYNDAFAPSEGYVSKVEKASRDEVCLNGLWEFQGVALPADYKAGQGIAPVLTLPEENRWDKVKIKIPSPWNINSFANRDLEGPDHRNYPSYPKEWENIRMAWMKKSVVIPSGWNNKLIQLHFEAVAGFAEVYVNGQKAGENFDLFLPFDVDITSFVTPGQPAEVLVGVRSQSLFEDRSTLGRRIVPAGSMWGYHVNGIWQDVSLFAVPEVHIDDIYIKPLVSQKVLELELILKNASSGNRTVHLQGDIRKWLNKAGTDVNHAPLPEWELERAVSLSVPVQKVTIPATGSQKITVHIPVQNGKLDYWTPEFPNLYGLTLVLQDKKDTIDTKYERFGWREWTFSGTTQLLNGKKIELRGDSWHFMGIPQLTRRYAWAWFTALKAANANAVRPHAQVYPRFYLDVADEMGICVLNETAIWASDGGPKMDSPKFWEACKDHLERLVLRDRNHASVFGWSISNENKPVILHVFNKPEWMSFQKKAWQDWNDIVRKNDSTRPWISSDGEDDGDGILPTTMGHYGDINSMKKWQSIGKPWGVGEHSMAYYGTPEQVSKYNGERAYESQLGRMEGLAYECYDLIANQRKMGASYVSVFNLAWYGLQPLPFGKRELTTIPSIESDGVFFPDHEDGKFGVQPERIGAYCSTFNPGYDPNLPLYITWPMFDAIKAANAPDAPAWSKWSAMPEKSPAPSVTEPGKKYQELFFIGDENSSVKKLFENHGITFSVKIKTPEKTLLIIDGNYNPAAKDLSQIKDVLSKGADLWLWAPVPATIDAYNSLFPVKLALKEREASSFIPQSKSWLRQTVNSDFYFCEIQQEEASRYGMEGELVDEGDVLLRACNTNWRKWNKRPEELKTAAVLRSENEAKHPDPVFVKYQQGCSACYVSTLNNFTSTEKGYNTLDKILSQAGIPSEGKKISETLIDKDGYVKISDLFEGKQNNRTVYRFFVWSPRPLDDLLIEPDMPKLDLEINPEHVSELSLNGKKQTSFKTLALKQGWNQVVISAPANRKVTAIRFKCENKTGFISQLKTAFSNPEL